MEDNFIYSDVDMNEIVDAIAEGNCIVVLGPELCLLKKEDGDVKECIQDHISNNVVNCVPKKDQIPYLNEEGFFYCTSDTDNQNILKKIRNFYKGLQPHEMYDDLWRMPFHLYISLSPDLLMKSAFPDAHPCQYDYHYGDGDEADLEKKKNIKSPSHSHPLVYNLMGQWEEKNSIVFTYEALFTYLTTIFSDNTARTHISNCLKDSNVILFLGFSFDKWYLKLLFFLIKKKWIVDNDHYKKIRKQAILFSQSTPKDNVLNYYKNEFNFSFCPLDQFEFVHKLYQACHDKGILRGQSKNKEKLLEELKTLVSSKKVEDAVMLLQQLSDDNTRKEIDRIKQDFSELTTEYNNGMVVPGEYEVRKNKIFVRLQSILPSIKIA